MLTTTRETIDILTDLNLKVDVKLSKNYADFDDEIKVLGTRFLIQCGRNYVILSELEGYASYDLWYIEITPKNDWMILVYKSLAQLKQENGL